MIFARCFFARARSNLSKKKMTAVNMSFSGRCCEPRWRLKYSAQCAILANGVDALLGTYCAVCFDAGRMELKTEGATGFAFWRCLKNAEKYHRQPVWVCFECNKNAAAFWFDPGCRFTRFSALLPARQGQPADMVLEENLARSMMFMTEPSKRGVTCANNECGAAELENSADKFLCCSRCLKEHDRYVYYCRTACQREHYALHAPLCRVK